MPARHTDVAAKHTCFARASEFGPSKSDTMCMDGRDASASSDDEPPGIWNALLEATVHGRVGSGAAATAFR